VSTPVKRGGADCRDIVADLVEVAPAYDTIGQTGLLAAAIVREFLLLLAPERDRIEPAGAKA